ncbi:MAG: YkgJ family cysteine cluster protein [Treponema sp.]
MNDFFENGLHFSCARCSSCCRHDEGFVYLSESDLSNLCEHFKMERESFISSYCRFVPYAGGAEVLSLLEKDNFDCILWQDGGCTAYNARPAQCSTYPFWTRILSSKRAWVQESAYCPGIDSGQCRTYGDILAHLSKYEENKKSLIHKAE